MFYLLIKGIYFLIYVLFARKDNIINIIKFSNSNERILNLKYENHFHFFEIISKIFEIFAIQKNLRDYI